MQESPLKGKVSKILRLPRRASITFEFNSERKADLLDLNQQSSIKEEAGVKVTQKSTWKTDPDDISVQHPTRPEN